MLRYITSLNDQDLGSEIKQLGSTGLSGDLAGHFRSGTLLKAIPENPDDFHTFVEQLNKGLPAKVYPYHDLPGQWLIHLPHTGFEALADFFPTIENQSQKTRFGQFLREMMDNWQLQSWHYRSGHRDIFIDRPMIMGILNVTPDSFSDGGRYTDPQKAEAHALRLADAGATIIDIGGESSRPGADPVDEDEEWRRIGPVIEALAGRDELLLSVDTYKAGIARKALQAGAHIINDISGLTMDEEMGEVIASFDVPVILMHMQNRPRNMQKAPHYDNLMDEVWLSLQEKIQLARRKGIRQMILDPGVGFGKRPGDNYELIRRLSEFRTLGLPLLIGVSRKSFLQESLNSSAANSLIGSISASLISIVNGAQIVRVHDVDEMRQALKILSEINLRKAS